MHGARFKRETRAVEGRGRGRGRRGEEKRKVASS